MAFSESGKERRASRTEDKRQKCPARALDGGKHGEVPRAHSCRSHPSKARRVSRPGGCGYWAPGPAHCGSAHPLASRPRPEGWGGRHAGALASPAGPSVAQSAPLSQRGPAAAERQRLPPQPGTELRSGKDAAAGPGHAAARGASGLDLRLAGVCGAEQLDYR